MFKKLAPGCHNTKFCVMLNSLCALSNSQQVTHQKVSFCDSYFAVADVENSEAMTYFHHNFRSVEIIKDGVLRTVHFCVNKPVSGFSFFL